MNLFLEWTHQEKESNQRKIMATDNFSFPASFFLVRLPSASS
jgi:hypothetical protein